MADTSIWIDHLRRADAQFTKLLNRGEILIHVFVIGEIALGSLADRARTLHDLRRLGRVTHAVDSEVLDLLDRHRLYGRGLGWVDLHLLAAALLTPGVRLWTRDRRLRAAAIDVGVTAL